jgi:hypothetical protein
MGAQEWNPKSGENEVRLKRLAQLPAGSFSEKDCRSYRSRRRLHPIMPGGGRGIYSSRGCQASKYELILAKADCPPFSGPEIEGPKKSGNIILVFTKVIEGAYSE